jgi:hypothetical protein
MPVISNSGKWYGMLSKAGDRRIGVLVDKVVKESREKGYTTEQGWDLADSLLAELARHPKYREAEDVREEVYDEIATRLDNKNDD